jgi:hypothetical protein
VETAPNDHTFAHEVREARSTRASRGCDLTPPGCNNALAHRVLEGSVMPTNTLSTLTSLDLSTICGGQSDNQMVTNYPNVMTPAQARREFPNNERLQLYYSDVRKWSAMDHGADAQHCYDSLGAAISCKR